MASVVADTETEVGDDDGSEAIDLNADFASSPWNTHLRAVHLKYIYLIDWLVDWLVDWLIDWFIDWLTAKVNVLNAG